MSQSVDSGIAVSGFDLRAVADIVTLGKPRIVALQLIATGCAMLVASGGAISLTVFVATIIGGGLISASAGAINHIWDRDIDAVMARTSDRPLPTGRLSLSTAWIWSTITGVLGFGLLYAGANPEAAWLALAGHLFYVFVYTMWLKRRTAQNIVIGGAAGGVPPMVGWVAVQGHLSMSALLMFLLTVLWTPPHFWALALNRNADYKRAGIPMLPVVAGEQATVRQMFWYAVALIPCGAAMGWSDPRLGWVSVASTVLLGAVFVWKVERLSQLIRSGSARKVEQGWSVFKYSIVYLALVFAALVADAFVI